MNDIREFRKLMERFKLDVDCAEYSNEKRSVLTVGKTSFIFTKGEFVKIDPETDISM